MNEIIENAREIISGYDGPKLRIMEVCGTHTHEIFRLGIRSLLPENIDLISGPGCPVCVTPVGYIDEAIFLALEKNCIICTFGDLIKVPGTKYSLAGARADGADVRPVYSPDDAVQLAQQLAEEAAENGNINDARQVVFLAVGFETTTPSACIAVKKAKRLGLQNFSILTANKTMPNTMSRYNQPKPPVKTSNSTFATSLSAPGAKMPQSTNAAMITAETMSTERSLPGVDPPFKVETFSTSCFMKQNHPLKPKTI